MIDAAPLAQLHTIVGRDHVVTDAGTLGRHSRDFYWFSPILKPQLDEKEADVIVSPATIEELRAVIALAVQARIPLTMRGAGTGNYGQGIPMQGGILLNTRRMDRILELTPDHIRVEAGALLHTMEARANEIGAELRFFPSTLQTATAGGFLAGGAGGIGSVTWGTLWDDDNVRAATILTVEEEPRLVTVDDSDGLRGVVHNCGLTCVIVDLTLALAPAQPWQQMVVAFDSFEDALRCGEALAHDESLMKRLVTVIDWPVPTFFRQLVRAGACPDGKALLLLQLVIGPDELAPRVAPRGGAVTWHRGHEGYLAGGIQLSDFTWNHTTLWAIKADKNFTYLQDMFDPQTLYQQLHARRARYGDDLVEHIEFMRFGGRMVPAGLTLVRYRSPEQIRELMAYCEEIGIWVANPHTHYLDEDVRWNGQPILDARARWDPYGLLNPGHLRLLEPGS